MRLLVRGLWGLGFLEEVVLHWLRLVSVVYMRLGVGAGVFVSLLKVVVNLGNSCVAVGLANCRGERTFG